MAKNKQQPNLPPVPYPVRGLKKLREPSYLAISLLAIGLVVLLWSQSNEMILNLWLLGVLSSQIFNYFLDNQKRWQANSEMFLAVIQSIIWALLAIFSWPEMLEVQIIMLFFMLLAAFLIHIRFYRVPFWVTIAIMLSIPLVRFISDIDILRVVTTLLIVLFAFVWFLIEQNLLEYRGQSETIAEQIVEEYDIPLQDNVLISNGSKNSNTDKASKEIKKNILIVEDNVINQQVVAEMLQALSVNISIADNGEQALEMVLEESFDLVLMDIQMPEMDGYEVTRRIRQYEQFQDLPIVAMTAYAMREDRTRCLAAGMNDHISKPFEPDIFYQTLGEWLNLTIDDKGNHIQPIAPINNGDSDLANLKGLDLQVGLKKVLNNQTLYRKLLHEFYEDFYTALYDIKKLLQSGDSQSVCKLLHRLKGASGNIAAIRLYQASAILEQQLKNRGAFDLKEFEESFSELTEGLARLKNPSDTAPEAVGNIDFQVIKPLLRELSQYLQEANPQAVELLPKITLAAHGNFTDLFKTLTEKVYTFQFEEAEIILGQINLKLQHMEGMVGEL